MDLKDKILAILKDRYLCDSCLGRTVGNLLSGYSNKERGRIVRTYIAMLVDSGEDIKIDLPNLYGIKFRVAKIEPKEPGPCFVCKGFFATGVNEAAAKITKRLDGMEFESFLVGSAPSDDMLNAENSVWEKVGIDGAESLKSEINREVGKALEKATGKKFSLKNPDVTVLVDLKNNRISLDVKGLFVAGGYKKLARGMPQTKWTCSDCGGKGCVKCKGKGKMYPTSVQEIIENPLLKASGGRKSFFHGSGREDINVRCLDWRPFIIEIAKPVKRKVDLKAIEKKINKSRRVNVRGLVIVETGREEVRRLKTARLDKTYLADVEFCKKIDRKRLPAIKRLVGEPILQKTPARVLHRRADKFRKRLVKRISWKLSGGKRLVLKVRAESGLYIKELVNGDGGRTMPSVAEMLDNKVKRISLDVVKIHVS